MTVLDPIISSGAALLLISLGAIVGQRAGLLNLGLEGTVAVSGVFGYLVGALTGQPYLGLMAGALVGLAFNSLFSLLSNSLTLDQITTGTALIMIGVGVSSVVGVRTGVYQVAIGKPVVEPVMYVAPAIAVAAWFIMRSKLGKILRAVGDDPYSTELAGVDVVKVRHLACLIEGLLGGLGGAYFTLFYAGHWSDGVTAGLGLLGVSIAMFSMWNAILAMPLVYAFSFLITLSYALQLALQIPAYLLNIIPYLGVVALLSILGFATRFRGAPRYLAIPYRREERR